VLGADIEVPTLEKKVLKLKIPPGTQDNAKFRLKNSVCPAITAPAKGTLMLKSASMFPKNLTEEQKELVASLAKAEL
jgi:DnaJ-class molecular chaperone